MATATLSFTLATNGRQRVGKQIHLSGTLTPSADDDYAAGGLSVSASTFGLNRLDDVRIHGVVADGATAATAFEAVYYDATAGKIQFFEQGAGAGPFPESNNTALSGYTLRVTAVGA